MDISIIFVGGIHGVGKTSFCKNIANKFKASHFSSSELISKFIKKEFNKNKTVKDIAANQDILIMALKECVDTKNTIFLDGHFCLLNEAGEITKIPEITFKNISPKAIIVLKDSAEKIVNRLNNRDNIQYDQIFIEKFQNTELDYSFEISQKLNVPYLVHNVNGDIDEVYNLIKKNIDVT